MSEGLTPKQITIVRIITMLAGSLGAIVVMSEQELFWGAGYRSSNVSNALTAMVGVLCFLNMIRHIRIWRKLGRPADKGNGVDSTKG